MKRSVAMLLCLLFAAPAAPAVAQDPPAPDPPAEAAGGEAEKFAATLAEWKDLLGEMRAAQVKYQNTTSDAETARIEEQWDELVASGEKLLIRLRKEGAAAFRAAPNRDPELTKLLMKIIKDDVDADRYEEAYEIALALALTEEQGPTKPLLGLAGMVCFCVNDYENAERIYKKAADMPGEMPPLAERFAELLPSYKKLWEEEQAARKRDAEAKVPVVRLKTNRGVIDVELFENEAPGAVGNFISLVVKKYYDGLTFHRVLKNFMAQGGCPDGTGTGGPGYNIYCECDKPDHRKHFRGTLSMAHAGPDTGGSQFFLTFVPTEHLNGRHTAFGRVVKGMDVLAKIRRREPNSADPPDVILEATVIRKDENKKYEPNRVQ